MASLYVEKFSVELYAVADAFRIGAHIVIFNS